MDVKSKIRIPPFLQTPPVLLVAVFILAFGPLMWGELVWKDLTLVNREPALSGQVGAEDLFLRSTPPNSATYQPLPALTLMVGLGQEPEDHAALIPRLFNIVLFYLISLLLLRLMEFLKVSKWTGFLVVAVFAIHPTHVEVLATLPGRAPLMGHLFALAALLLILQSSKSPKRSWIIFSLFVFAGLSQKAALAWGIIPFVLASLRLTPQPSLNSKRAILAGATVVFLLQWICTGSLWPNAYDRFLDSGSLLGNLASSMSVMGLAFPALLLLPQAMTPDPSANLIQLSGALWSIGGFLVLGLLCYVAWRHRKTYPLPTLGCFIFFIGALFQSPMLAGSLPSQLTFFGSSFSIPFLLVLPFSWARALAGRKRLAYALPVLILFLCTLRSLAWRHEDILLASLPGTPGPTYWAHELKEIEEAAVGSELARKSPQALLTKAIDAAGPDQRLVKQALLIELKRGGSVSRCQELLTILQTERPTLVGLSALRGRTLLKAGDRDGAQIAFTEGRNTDDFDIDSRWFLGAACARQGQDDWAEMYWREALKKCQHGDQQETALKILIQLSYMTDRGVLDKGVLMALCQRQLSYLPSIGSIRTQIEGLIARINPQGRE